MVPFDVRVNPMGIAAIRVHYRADPEKCPETESGQRWYEAMRRLYPDPNQWEREFEISWWIAQGLRVFPEFNETIHCQPIVHRDRKMLYRAWDFGWHAPACLIAQVDPKDRLLVLREVVGNQQTTRDFAKQVIARCAEWFPRYALAYTDFCDPAGQQASSTASERSEVRDVEVLQALGIFPTWEHGWNRKDGRSLIHQLLVRRTDDTPSLYVNQVECPVLIQGFLGKYVYPGTENGRAQDEPDEGNHPWADVMAALRYLATGLYSALGLRRFKYQPVLKEAPLTYHGYGTPTGRPAAAREPWPGASEAQTTAERAGGAWRGYGQ